MNRHILLPAASLFALLLGGGCSKSPSPAPDDPQKGAIAFDCTVSPEVAVVADGTKAGATRTLPASCLPAPEQMKLKLKLVDPDKTFEMTYESMVDYDQPLLDPGSYTAGFSYGDPAEEGPDAAYFVGSTTCTIVAQDHYPTGIAYAGQCALHAPPLRLVQELLHLLQPDRLYRIGLPERTHAGSGYKPHADFRTAEHQTLPQRQGHQDQRRRGRIPEDRDRRHRRTNLAQHRDRRRIGRTGEPRPAFRRHPHHGRDPGNRTEPRSLTTRHRTSTAIPKYDSI